MPYPSQAWNHLWKFQAASTQSIWLESLTIQKSLSTKTMNVATLFYSRASSSSICPTHSILINIWSRIPLERLPNEKDYGYFGTRKHLLHERERRLLLGQLGYRWIQRRKGNSTNLNQDSQQATCRISTSCRNYIENFYIM